MNKRVKKIIYLLVGISLILTHSPITAQNIIIVQPGPADGIDNRVWSLDPNTSFPDHVYIKANAWTWNSTFGIERSYLKFDLHCLTPNMEIDEAKLSFYYHYLPGNPEQTNYGANSLLIQRTTTDWTESSVTWANQPSISTINEILVPPATNPHQDYLNIDVTNLLNDAIVLNDYTFPFLVRIKDEFTFRRFAQASSDYPDPERRPKLEIFYTCFVDLGNDTIICSQDTLSISAGEYFMDYLWNTGAIDPSINISSSGTYWVEVTDEYGCIASDTIVVDFFPDPSELLNLGNDTVICNNDTILLSAGEGFETYLWQDGSENPEFIVTEPGLYYVIVANQCGEATDSIYIGLAAGPNVNLGGDTILCFGESIVLSPGNFYFYQWQDGSNEPTYNVNAPGLYFVTVSDDCGQSSDSIQINYYPEITVDLGNDTILCAGESIMLFAGSGFASYLWQDGSTSPFLLTSDNGYYEVEVTDINGCSASDEIYIDQMILEPELGPDTLICPDTEIILSTDLEYMGYIWGDSLGFDPEFLANAGTIWVRVFDSVDQKVCYGYDTITIGSLEVPQLPALLHDYYLCQEDSLSLNISIGDQYTYQWANNVYDSLLTISLPGYYSYTISNNCGSVSDTVFLNELPSPQPEIQIDTLPQESSLLLYTEESYHNYWWNDGSQNPVLEIEQPGDYWLSVENEEGCLATDSISIEPWECEMYIPAAFTPNGDSYNDYFYVDANSIQQFSIQIFNRWGEKVFISDDVDFYWDGTNKSNPCAEGTYFYIISYNCTNFTSQIKQSQRKGTITLLR
ncbi:MAG: DNRLRE domain-containing protein [Bacteroidales bacterium]|nr:DNRLRE domain-containing protein [Bacteroidales bacterium]MCF8402397.1 DNRLRE domain-containing protein [Bacteroidales bacterium]